MIRENNFMDTVPGVRRFNGSLGIPFVYVFLFINFAFNANDLYDTKYYSFQRKWNIENDMKTEQLNSQEQISYTLGRMSVRKYAFGSQRSYYYTKDKSK